jgi:hypothetical protein
MLSDKKALKLIDAIMTGNFETPEEGANMLLQLEEAYPDISDLMEVDECCTNPERSPLEILEHAKILHKIPETDEEVVEIIRKLSTGGYGSEHENSRMLNYISNKYSGISDLIFWDNRNLTPEEILEEARIKCNPKLN